MAKGDKEIVVGSCLFNKEKSYDILFMAYIHVLNIYLWKRDLTFIKLLTKIHEIKLKFYY